MVVILNHEIPGDVLLIIGWYVILGFGSFIIWMVRRRGGS